MNFFKKFFGKESEHSTEKQPENTRLIFLMNNWSENPSDENYKLVMEELLHGNSYLILPTLNSEQADLSENWTIAEQGMTLKLTSVYNLDGLKVLGAFSDEKSLLTWAKKPTTYTAVQSNAVLDLCREINIHRIVINSDCPNMFVLERAKNFKPITIKKDTKVLIGTLSKPLSNEIVNRLVENFQKVGSILEAYQYTQAQNQEATITIGLKLFPDSENARTAALNAVQNALLNESNKFYLDIFIIESDDWYDIIKNVEDALFYKKDSIIQKS